MKSKYVALHEYLESGYISLVGFGDDSLILEDICRNERHFGSNRHRYFVMPNDDNPLLSYKKDVFLINICENVAQYLAIGEYAMLKKSYFKAQTWFERAKDSAKCASMILENY